MPSGNLDDEDDEDEDYDDVTVTAAEEDASVQIDVFGSPEVDDEAAVSILPTSFPRTGRVRCSTDLFTRNMA